MYYLLNVIIGLVSCCLVFLSQEGCLLNLLSLLHCGHQLYYIVLYCSFIVSGLFFSLFEVLALALVCLILYTLTSILMT